MFAASMGAGLEAGRVVALELELKRAREALARSEQVLRSAVEYAIVTLDMEGLITGWNAGAERVLGYAEADVLGLSGEIVFTEEDRAEGRFTHELCRAIETGRAENERWHVRQDGTQFWASGVMLPLRDADGEQTGFLNVLRDGSGVHGETERRELLLAEMSHRIKNTFATVQAVAAQTGRYSSTIAEYQFAFGNRLLALARSHDMLIEGGGVAAPLRDVVAGALGAYCADADRATIDGVGVVLPADLVVTLTLAFHELAINACKHGALSVPDGRVDVSWVVRPREHATRRMEITWRESGGPPVRPPQRRGFGTQLLGRGLGPSGAAVKLEFPPEGAVCRIELPLGVAT